MDLVTIGESMLRLSPPDTQRLEGASVLSVHVAGSESNVAVAMARLGKQAAWVSRLPDTPMGHTVANMIRLNGVDTSRVIWAEYERLGLMFVENGSPPRPTRAWYDRAHSAASKLTPADLPLDLIAEARWLHLSGITPALSESCAATIRAALNHAHQHRRSVSFDVNYRALLWSTEQAAVTLEPFCRDADVVLVALRDARSLFGVSANADAVSAAHELQQCWGGLIIVTQGDSGTASDDGTTTAYCNAYPVTIVDRIGAGDAFAAGAICRLLENATSVDMLQFGAALAALKLTVPGDFSPLSRQEVETLISTNGSIIHR